MPFTSTVLRIARSDPQRLAIAAEGHRLSYAELLADGRQLAAAVRHLLATQARPPAGAPEMHGLPLIASSTTSAFETARIFAGLAGYGMISATIDPRWPLAHRVDVIARAGVRLVVSDASDLTAALQQAGWGGTVISPGELTRLQAALPTAEPPTVRAADEAFLLLFSSGTTHNPKAFLKTRQQYRDNYAICRPYLGAQDGVVTWAPGPVSYSLTLWALLECLASGGSAILSDTFDPLLAARTITTHAVTRIVAVPAMVRAIATAAAREPAAFTGVKLVVTGGAYLPPATRAAAAAHLPHAELVSYYGAAEIGFIGDSHAGDGTRIRLYDSVQAQLRRDDGSPIPPGNDELGTLWIHTPACSDGYVAGTSTEILRDAQGWATVHDQGRWDGDQLHLVGRAGDIAITGGHKVSLAEVERAFDQLPGIRAACAIALPDTRRGSVIALVVEGAADKAELLRAARRHLAPQYVPRHWYATTALPRTVGGKLRRGATATLVQQGQARAL